ncbi:MAG: efflux RND transporter permease subunit, partial [Pseudomonadota bacterium]|nr:efflux RND transporter permease subunit [Pseudomonadota bacterium]
MSLFFLNRPVFAWVIAIGIMVIGLLSINNLPIQQYPTVAPPVVSISATYPGASAPTVENSVTQIIEQSLTGIDNMRYFSASSSNSASNIMVTFEPGTNPDIAQVQVQNKVQTALPFLPASVQQQGIIVNKGNDTFLMVVGFYSENDSVSQNELSDLLVTNIQDQLARVEGVGSVSVFGSEAAMRIWLNPDQLNQFDITPMEVYAAIQAQNVDISAGQIGGLPAVEGQQINAAILAQSKLQSTEDFENIQLKTLSNGAQVKLGDVARVELGAENYDAISRYKRHPATGIAITLATGANALATADAVKSRMTELQATLPDSVNVIYPFET